MLRRVLFSLAVLLALSAEAHAGGELRLLAGVKAVGVVIEDLPPDAARCGVSEDMLRSTAILVLKKNTALSIVENASQSIYVNLGANGWSRVFACMSAQRLWVFIARFSRYRVA
jgi:hypothetical protein